MRIPGFNPEDIFIRRIQNALLQESIAGWRRRGKMLLDINCGDGRFLRPLWHNGFDVTATETDATLRARAAAALRNHAEIYAASDTHLPFEDASFDWAVLHITRSDTKTLQPAIAEAARVCAHGLAVTFWNTTAPVFMLTPSLWKHCPGIAWISVWLALQSLNAGTVTSRTTLLFSFAFLRRLWPKLYFNSLKTRLPLGAFATLRLDMTAQSSVTPLALPTHRRRMNRLEPLLEYEPISSQKGRPRQPL